MMFRIAVCVTLRIERLDRLDIFSKGPPTMGLTYLRLIIKININSTILILPHRSIRILALWMSSAKFLSAIFHRT